MKLHCIIKNKGWDTSQKSKELSSEDHLKGVFAKIKKSKMLWNINDILISELFVWN